MTHDDAVTTAADEDMVNLPVQAFDFLPFLVCWGPCYRHGIDMARSGFYFNKKKRPKRCAVYFDISFQGACGGGTHNFRTCITYCSLCVMGRGRQIVVCEGNFHLLT